MATEIIPRKVAPVPLWQNILFYVLMALLLGAILSYFILGHLERKSLSTIQNLEEAITAEKTPQKIALGQEILTYQKKIDSFVLLLDYHLRSSKFFDFLQKTAHPRIWFSQVSLNPRQALAVVSGQAETFTTLGQQLLIFEKEPLVKNVTLSKISLGKKGEIEFTLNLSFGPEFFK